MESYDVIVIGSGPGGYVAAIRCAQLGLKTACVEKDPNLGGTCLNVGCIPSKALLHSTETYYNLLKQGPDLGIDAKSTFNFPQMMKRKETIVKGFNQGIAGLLQKNKITHIQGLASFTSPTTISVSGKEYTARHFIIATGSEPTPLPFLPFNEKTILSSTGALSLPQAPKKMLVIGAGIIGVELGSVYSRLGTEVKFIEFLDRICPTLDPTLSKALQKILENQGLTFQLSSKVTAANGKSITYTNPDGKEATESADVILVSIGRRPYTQDLALDKAQIQTDEKGRIPINSRLQTSQSHIYAIGDVVDGPMLAHKASEEGVLAAEIISGLHPHLEYMTIPSVVYTHPEVAAVGLTEPEAKALNLPLKIGQFPFKANSRARATNEDEGFIKLIAHAEKNTILGVHILGAHAGELIAEAALAIQKRATTLDIIHTSHAHPTLSEALKEAALDAEKRAIHK